MIFGEDDAQPEPEPGQPHRQQVRLDASQMETIYANSFALASSPDEITVYLGCNSPLPGMKQPTVKMVSPIHHSSAIISSPKSAYSTLISLLDHSPCQGPYVPPSV